MLGIDFKSSFEGFMMKRTEELGALLSNNEEYSKLNKKFMQLFEDISAKMPAEERTVLTEFDSVVGSLDALMQTIMYQKGIADGMEMKNILTMTK